MDFLDVAIMLLAEQEHKTIHSIVKTDMETGEVIQCSIPCRDGIKI